MAQAHCDIPCGIYDATPAKIAAMTVKRMVEQLLEIKSPENMDDEMAILQYNNMVMRRVTVKEQHAQLCEKELVTLWSDFFKNEHHDIFWSTIKLCSKCAQEINIDAATDLVNKIDEIAKLFYDTKKQPEKYEAYKKITDTLY